MKILQIHKYYSKKRGGGSVSAFFETKELLERKGHEVVVFSMSDKDNEFSNESKFFAQHFDIREAKNIFQKIYLVPRVIYNREAAKKLDTLLTVHKPDVAHVHNIYHYLTPSIFPILKKHKVPIIFKLSDYHAICPNYKLFAHGKIDNSCKNKRYYKLFFNKSINNSWAESFVAMIEGYVNKWGRFYDNVDIFTAPSEFMKKIGIEYGLNEKKIRILRNVLNFDKYNVTNVKKEKFFLYMGRVSEEKGLITAINAMAILKNNNSLKDWKFVIAGHGPQLSFLKKYTEEKQVNDVVQFVGFCKKGGQRWMELMQKSSVAILPAVWYDNSPIAISESMAFATSVIVSDYGGTKEMIKDGENGFIFKTGDDLDLSKKMQIFINDEKLIIEMGKNARKWIKQLNNEELYYKKLIDIYKEAIDVNKNN